MRSNGRKKKKGIGGFITVLITAVIVFFLLPAVREVVTGRDGAKTMPGSDRVKEYLRDYLDPDARVIYAQYDGIEEDIAAYQDPFTDAMTEEERRQQAEHSLQADYLEKEIQRALQNRERQICVIGRLGSSKGYVNNVAAGPGYDGGVFRTMPYSTFWMKSYEAYTGSLTEGRFGKTTFEDHFFIYTFEYYDLQDDEILEMKNSIDLAADDILSRIPAGADLWQKCRTIHDELVKRTEYDHDFADHSNDLYGALVNHKAVCEGYALAFQYVLNRTGENCDVIVSNWENKSDATAHAWNRIHAPTYEQYIDVTWDDTGSTDGNGEPVVSYDYFGLTEEEMAAVDSHEFESGLRADIGGPAAFNYYRHEGYLLTAYTEEAVTELFSRQYSGGEQYMTVRFSDQPAYREAFAGLFEGEGMNRVLDVMGYYGPYWYSTNEDLCIISVGLGTVSEQI